MRWGRECGAPAAACPHRLKEVAGSAGLTSAAFCTRGGQACPALFAREHVALGAIGGCVVVAGYRVDRLRGRRLTDLYDVLPAIRADEWEIALSFARDYTARGIAWAVVVRGEVFSMLKMKG